MNFILNLIVKSSGQVWLTFLHNWPYLGLSVALAVLLKLYLDPKRISAFLLRYQKAGVVAATTVAVTTPLCSCGTTAIVLGMIANFMPWAPIVAFMVSSPLTSPQELVYSAGLFGWPFALTFYSASIVLGLLGGAAAGILDRRGWLANQTRQLLAPVEAAQFRPQSLRSSEPAAASRSVSFAPSPLRVLEPAGCACEAGNRTQLLALDAIGCACDVTEIALPAHRVEPACGCSQNPSGQPAAEPACSCSGGRVEMAQRVTLRRFLAEMFDTGQRLLVMFLGFAFIGYFLNGLIPTAWVSAVFGSGNAFSVPLAAILGLPPYVNSEASLPLVRTMMEAGMGPGAGLAFLITGAGTSFGAVAGMLTIARWRVVALIIGTLWVGAVLFGVGYNLVF